MKVLVTNSISDPTTQVAKGTLKEFQIKIVWKNKFPRVNKKTLCGPTLKGGILIF